MILMLMYMNMVMVIMGKIKCLANCLSLDAGIGGRH